MSKQIRYWVPCEVCLPPCNMVCFCQWIGVEGLAKWDWEISPLCRPVRVWSAQLVEGDPWIDNFPTPKAWDAETPKQQALALLRRP